MNQAYLTVDATCPGQRRGEPVTCGSTSPERRQVGEHATDPAGRVVSAFATALTNGDVTTAAAALTNDVVLTDLALHT